LLRRQLPNRRGDVGGCKHSRRHLVQQWLEDVMVATVYDRDIGFAVSQCFDGRNAGEAPADDHDMRFC
jgi:hypothetical protein